MYQLYIALSLIHLIEASAEYSFWDNFFVASNNGPINQYNYPNVDIHLDNYIKNQLVRMCSVIGLLNSYTSVNIMNLYCNYKNSEKKN